MSVEFIAVSTLLLGAVGLLVRMVWVIFKLPHKCRFYTHDYPCVRYASCYCGAGIAIDTAIKNNVPIYAKEHGGRLY